MKSVTALILFWGITCTALFAQSSICENGYLAFKEGVSFELTSYNAKGKVSSVVDHMIDHVTSTDNGFKATVSTNVMDDKGKSAVQGQYSIECRDDGLYLDISSMLSPETMKAFGSMQVDVTGDALSIPNTMHPGQTLPDGEMTMKASMNGMSLMKLTVSVTDRKVTGTEQRTTPAGTFDCIIIEQQTTLSGFGKNSYASKSWYAKGVGMVRTENYGKKGDLSSYTELTKFSK